MPWTSTASEEIHSWEPFELVVLKQKLANLSCNICKCLSDRINRAASTSKAVSIHSPNDKEVQVGDTGRWKTLDQSTQASRDVIRRDREDLNYSLTTDAVCPSCYVTMNLLRGRVLKILKDEQSETKAEMFSADKFTEKKFDAVDQTTSYTTCPQFGSNELDEVVSDIDTYSHQGVVRRTSPLVKFGEVTMNSIQQTGSIEDQPQCLCLQRFVDSIRPPFANLY